MALRMQRSHEKRASLGRPQEKWFIAGLLVWKLPLLVGWGLCRSKFGQKDTLMMLKEWFSAQECADLLGMSKAGFIKMAARKEYRTRPRQGRGGGLEYHYSSLPLPAQEALLRAESRAVLAEPPKPSKSRELALSPVGGELEDPEAFARRVKADGDAQAAQLAGRAKARMDAKSEIIQAILAAQRAESGVGIVTLIGRYNDGRITVSDATRALKPTLSIPNFYRWRMQMDRSGLASLAGRYGNRAGTGRIDSQPQLAVALRALLCDKPHIQPKHAAEFLAARYADSGLQLPGVSAVRRWIERWKAENHELFTRLRNPDEWKSRYESAIGDASAHIVRLNQEWQADSTPADVLLTDGRHSLLFLLDVYSRRLKIHVSRTSTAAAVAHVLRRGLLDWGVAEVLKTDNGQDYVAQHITQILNSLDIEHIRCLPFEARGKGHVERVIRTFAHDLLELLPGYIGHNVAERQQLRERQQFADRLYVKNAQVEIPLSAAELQAFCDRWVRAYENTPHAGLEGRRPLERIANWTAPVRRVANERALDLLLAPAPGKNGWRTLQKADGINIDGYEYLAPEFGLHVRDRVRVLYDPEGDAGKIYVFDAKGGFIAIAECPELTGIDRAELAAHHKALQKLNVSERAAAARAEAKTVDTKGMALEILRDRERLAPLAALPKPAETHDTPALRAAAAALEANVAPPVPEVSEEAMRRLREEMRIVEPDPSVLSEPDHFSAFACVQWRFERILQGKVALQDVPEEWREYVQWYYREYAKDRGRFLEDSLKDFYPQFEQVKAYLLNTGGEEADAASMAG